jgi:peptidoglycan DL-endopeptidase CwlO
MLLSCSTTIFANPVSDQIQQQQDIISQNRKMVDDINKTTQSIESSIEALDESIAVANGKITDNKNQINNTKIQIEKAEKDIVEAQAKMDEEQELFDQRMRAIYINGNDGVSGYISILLESKGMSDFLSRIGTVKKLAELDKKILSDLKSQQDVVQSKKEALNTDKAKLEVLVADNEAKLAKLNVDRQAQVVLINKSKQEASKYSAKINSANSLIKKIRESVPKISPSRGAVPISSNAIVAFASNYIGTPYVYGANGPSSFDCSGFTKYVFAHFGVNLNRVAVDQASQGTSVSRDNLSPGDLVFFGGSMGSIHHVGIYVGDGCYIHAPYTGTTVQVSSMGRTDFICAKRVY